MSLSLTLGQLHSATATVNLKQATQLITNHDIQWKKLRYAGDSCPVAALKRGLRGQCGRRRRLRAQGPVKSTTTSQQVHACSNAVLHTRGVTHRCRLLMQLYLVPQCQRPAACRLQSKCPCTARARPLRNIGYNDRPQRRIVDMRRQLRSSGTVVSASDSKQADHAAVGPSRQLGLWTAVDAAATVGSIVGALAFFITSEAVIASVPVILPLVAWYAGRQKEGLQVEVSTARFLPRLLSCQLYLQQHSKVG